MSVSIGSAYASKELPYFDPATGETKQLKVGNFFNELVGQSILRDSQMLNIFFHELLAYTLTPNDRTFSQNH